MRRAAMFGAAAGMAVVWWLAESYLRTRYRERVTRATRAPHDTITIVALGDSITAGFEAGPAPPWSERLQTQLQAAFPQQAWRVLNAGVPGDTAPLGLSRFDRDAGRAVPDLVLIAFGLNDCHLNRHALDLWFEEHLPLATAHSYLWRALRTRLGRALRAAGLRRDPTPETHPQRAVRTSLHGFGRALTELVERATLLQTQPVLLTMTPLADTSAAAVTERLATYAAYNEQIRRVAARTQTQLVVLASAPGEIWQEDGVHVTAAGQAWIAAEVFAQLNNSGTWGRLLRRVADGGECRTAPSVQVAA